LQRFATERSGAWRDALERSAGRSATRAARPSDAIPPDRDEQSVREFSAFTSGLHELADWLQACRVTTVAMESTGVYWVPLYDLLEEHGIQVPGRDHAAPTKTKTRGLLVPWTSWR
jgi:transposase